jgi:NitT/TauT family transport system permease protein
MAEGTFDIDTVFAGLLGLTLLAPLLDFAVMLAERKLLIWRPAHSETETL